MRCSCSWASRSGCCSPCRPWAGPPRRSAAIAILLGIELAQGAIGFVQYFTDLPEVLVGFHMLGAALVSAAVTWALLPVRSPTTRA